MKILLTGSHFTPAQAVIEELKKNPQLELIYIGRNYTREGDKSPSVESQIIPKLGVKFISITTGRLQRKFTIYTIPSLLKIPVGFIQSLKILRREKPDVVVSFGGYVSVPVVIAGWLMRIPIIVHEQTLVSGLANQISNLFASKIAVTFDKEYDFKKAKTVVTGNPIRQEIIHPQNKLSSDFSIFLDLAKKHRLPIILITGGNQGSHVINETVDKALEKLTEQFFVIHQTGDSKYKDFEKLSVSRKNLTYPERYLPVKWCEAEDFGLILRQTDIVVSRAGMNTLLELAYVGVPTLLIPVPYVQKDEQNVNAKYFKKLGLAEILDQDNLTDESLLKTLDLMEKHHVELRDKARQAKSVVIPDAAQRLIHEILLLARHS